MVSLGPIQLGNPAGLWWLLSLLPLILLYLIRPRPKPIKIPSLIFFMKAQGSKKLTSFFKQITKDWLFLIQLIILLALAFTFAQPFTEYQHDITAANTVIVIDVSASMHTQEGARTRFQLAVNEARKSLGAQNTIILAKDVPYIAHQDVNSQDASRYLTSLAPRSTTSQIGEAIILAGETLAEGRVVVISDFINTAGQDPQIAKSVLESKGLVVDFINIGNKGKKNVGIIDIVVSNDDTTLYVKNYDDQAYNTRIQVGKTSSQLAIPAQGVETYSFSTPPGATSIEVLHDDDLSIDNTAYISAPAQGKAQVLLITNNESVFLANALRASGEVDLTIAKPPVIPKEPYDVTIIHNVDMDELLPGTFEDIKNNLNEGRAVIIHVQADSANINYKGLSPVNIGEQREGGIITVDQLNTFTKNIEFGATHELPETALREDTAQIASVNEQPIIALREQNAKYVYYGIPEDSEFKYSTSYPIFWTELIKHLTAQQDIRNLNYKAGETIILEEEQTIQTPSKTVRKNALVLDEQGIYQFEDRVVAVNLANEQESNINAQEQVGTQSTDYELKPVKETREFPWTLALLLIALFMLLFEQLFIKRRGDV